MAIDRSRNKVTWMGRVAVASAVACSTAFLTGCGDGSPSGGMVPDTYRVSGAVVRGGAPVAGVPVSVDSAANWTNVTDAGGRFAIAGVTAGAHTVSVSTSDTEGSFSERQAALEVMGDVNLDALVLPAPLALGPAVVTGRQIQLGWGATDADDFREYKLYRRDSPGIDDIAGELVYVSTVRDQTTFVDTDLLAGKTYYYRVYAMNALGRLGGSNVVSTTFNVSNLIIDGDFENSAVLSGWTIDAGLEQGTVTRDGTVAHGGVASLHMTTGTSAKMITPIAIQDNVAYDLNLFAKFHGKRNNIDDAWIGIYQGPTIVASFPLDITTVGSAREGDVDWMSMGPLSFSVTSEGAITIQITSDTDEMWIDDLVLLPHQTGP